MNKPYKTVETGGIGEIIEKKSRFIAEVCHVTCEEQAEQFIEAVKKKHREAAHNCFAYVLGGDAHIQRCSDDGEPAKTAGHPMLDVLAGQAIQDTAIVVTRYFGGTLLGTGGLVRAYTKAAQAGLLNSVIITRICGSKLKIQTDYAGHGKIQYLLLQKNLLLLDTVYADNVCVEVLIPQEKKQEIESELINGTSGKAVFMWGEQCYYAEINGEVKIFKER